MSSLLLIKTGGEARAAALLIDGRLYEYRESRGAGSVNTGEVYLGRVTRVMKNLQASFVRLAEGIDGFLPFDETPGGQPQPGDSLLVQVKKPPLEGKAAYLTGRIALQGSCFSLLCREEGSHLSRKVKGEEKRKALYRLSDSLCPKGLGLLMREEALLMERQALADEVGALHKKWQGILEAAARKSAPARIEGAEDVVRAMLNSLSEPPEKIICDRPESLPDYGLPVTQAADPFQLYEAEHKLRRALRRRQHLKSGATLVIDPCEALWAIDVNTAANIAGKDREKTLLETNLEAAREIARLMRLRRMGGIILIDFIDMQSNEEREQVLAALREALARDPVPTSVHGFTSLGLVELTRKKAEPPLDGESLLPCPLCGGRGLIYQEENEDEA